MIASRGMLREASFRREYAQLTAKQKDALLRRMLIQHIKTCKVLDLHKLRFIQKLIESSGTNGQKKK